MSHRIWNTRRHTIALTVAAAAATLTLAACSSDSTPDSATSSSTPSPSASSDDTTQVVITGGVWDWRSEPRVTLELVPGSVVTLPDTVGATGAISDNEVAVFTPGDPVTITASGVGATSGYISNGDDTSYFSIIVTGSASNVDKVAADVVGLTEDEANRLVTSEGFVFRVVQRDGEALPVTQDYSGERINVVVTGKRVTVATVG